MSPLERLGLEVVAFDLLGRRVQAATLVKLLEAKGRNVGWSDLASVRMWRMADQPDEMTRKSIQVRICLLRAAMDDVGLGGLIKTNGGDDHMCPAHGYSLPEPGRTEVLNRLMEAVS